LPALLPDSRSALPTDIAGTIMSKGMNQKKQEKKKPAKTLEEKRAAKKVKKTERAFLQRP
jgi:hypothetical protein